MKKNTKKFLIVAILAALLIFGYLIVPTFIYPDSTIYYHTAKILLNLEPISSWDIVRGPTMAIIQYPFLKLFGNNEFSLRICTCVFYLVLLATSYWFINKEIKERKKNKKFKTCMTIIFIIMLLLNPILYGYYHGLLTEFAATTISIINLIIVTHFNKKEQIENKKYILLLIYISLGFVLAWFLKQPYFTIAFFPVLTLLFLKIKNKKSIIENSLLLIIPIIVLLCSIVGWKNYITSKGVDYENGENNSHFLNNAIIDGNTNYEKKFDEEYYTIEGIREDVYLSETEKKEIINKLESNNKNYRIYYIHNLQDEIIDAEVFVYESDSFSTMEALKFTLKAFVNHPIIVIDSYISNYLASINVYVSSSYKNYYRPYKDVTDFNGENSTIGLTFLDETDSNFKWIQSWHTSTENLEVEYKNIDTLGTVEFLSKIHLILFKVLYLILPLFWGYLLINVIKGKKKFETSFIFITFVFLHTVFHAVTGAIIDRYIYISYPAYICGIISYITSLNRSKKMKKNNTENKPGKILFVIPAYNEAENIDKVLHEIREDVNYADILVINDCSIDNTKQIVEDNKVPCITNIFNMKYAMAVQTGIKYAYENNYDYVIQFDADGQHIAKEAEKLYNTMLENNCDIVIGSRYLKDTGYPCPAFRRLGTKMFEKLIKIFCDEKIADPLSGFQCLNRKVIERYAKMGKYPEFPDANLVIEMLREGYSIKEVPVKMRLREAGESMHGGILKPIKYMINMFYTIVFIVISTPRKREE